MAINNDILDLASAMNCQELHFISDNKNNLRGVIAIHNTNLGSTLGGCRWLEYDSTYDAVKDAIRLAQGMTYKSAISNLPLGGGKAVLIKPKDKNFNKEDYFKEFGRFVNRLNGRYIAAVDSGTSPEEMDIIATQTKYVANTTKIKFSHPDPSIMTSHGVLYGIEAAVKYKLNETDLSKLKVAIQGLGHTGYKIAKLLHEKGAKLVVYDVNKDAVARCVNEFNAESVDSVDKILAADCDVYCPCALGAIINKETISLLKAKIVAGAANNQLKNPQEDSKMLLDKGILYAPDFVINAGGVIYVAGEHINKTEEQTSKDIHGIYDTLMEVFTRSKRENKTTYAIAHDIVVERLNGE